MSAHRKQQRGAGAVAFACLIGASWLGTSAGVSAQDVASDDVTSQDSPPQDSASHDGAPNDTPVAPPSEAFRALVIEAVEEYDRGYFEEAMVTFERARGLRDSARVHRGIGMCLFELRRYAEAVEALDSALEGELDPLTDSIREDVLALRARAQRNVGTLIVEVRPATAQVRIDGRVMAAGTPHPVDAGPHEVTASAEGRQTETRTVRVDGGASEAITLTLLAPAVQRTVMQVPAPAEQDDAWAVTALVLGVAGVGGVIGGAAWLANRDAAVATCADAISNGAECGNGDAIVLQRNLAGVTVGISAAALVGAAVVLLVGLASAEEAGEGAAPSAFGCGLAPDAVGCAAELRW